MVCFGAIVVEPFLDRTFYGRLKPISEHSIDQTLYAFDCSWKQILPSWPCPSSCRGQLTRQQSSGVDGRPPSTKGMPRLRPTMRYPRIEVGRMH